MTDNERMLARALSPSLVSYPPATSRKRFASDMASQEHYAPEKPLTPGQSRYLCKLAIQFRRQVAPDIVELARSMLDEVEGSAA